MRLAATEDRCHQPSWMMRSPACDVTGVDRGPCLPHRVRHPGLPACAGAPGAASGGAHRCAPGAPPAVRRPPRAPAFMLPRPPGKVTSSSMESLPAATARPCARIARAGALAHQTMRLRPSRGATDDAHRLAFTGEVRRAIDQADGSGVGVQADQHAVRAQLQRRAHVVGAWREEQHRVLVDGLRSASVSSTAPPCTPSERTFDPLVHRRQRGDVGGRQRDGLRRPRARGARTSRPARGHRAPMARPSEK